MSNIVLLRYKSKEDTREGLFREYAIPLWRVLNAMETNIKSTNITVDGPWAGNDTLFRFEGLINEPVSFRMLSAVLLKKGTRELLSSVIVSGDSIVSLTGIDAKSFFFLVRNKQVTIILENNLFSANAHFAEDGTFSDEEEILSFASEAFDSGDEDAAMTVLCPAKCFSILI